MTGAPVGGERLEGAERDVVMGNACVDGLGEAAVWWEETGLRDRACAR